MEIALITLPIFLLITLGYILRSVRVITKPAISVLNNFVYWIALPAVILVSFWDINWFDEATRTVLLSNIIAVGAFAAILFILLTALPFSKQNKAGIFVAALVGNTVYMGFPIGERAFGDSIYDLFLAAATPHLVIGIAISIVAVEWFLLKSYNPFRYLKDFFCNPLIISLAIGIVLSLLQVSGVIVDILKEPLTMLALTASPIALVTLGAFLRGSFRFSLLTKATFASMLKLVGLPVTVFVTAHILGLTSTIAAVSTLAAAMPTAVTSFVIAEKYKAAPELVAASLSLSTLLSLVTITGLLLFLL